ncbi:MAG: S9 family peptidase [Bacteroidaceae bacterium]|nr:S9 family peptidase [Bacteroidaceae bacterium]
MLRRTFTSLFLLTLTALAVAQGRLDLDNVLNYRYYPEYVYGVTPMQDGESYTQLSDDGTQIVRRSFRTGEQLAVLFDCAVQGRAAGLSRISGYTLSPDERTVLLETARKAIYRHSYTAQFYVCDLRSGRVTPLSDKGAQQQPLFSPDGTMVAFVRDGDLFISKLLFDGAEVRVTNDGKFNEIINGLPDWVNEEEFTTARSFDFSADSKMLAWVRYDESRVPVYHMQMFKGLAPEHGDNDAYPGSYDYKYPVAGAENSRVEVKTYDIASHAVRVMDVPMDSDSYIPRIKFTDDPDKLAVVTLNRLQNRMDIYMVNPRSTVATLAVRETSQCYVKESAYEDLQFFGNRMALTSTRSGYRHVYLYTLSGELVRQATQGDFDVTAFYGYDPKKDCVYYAARATSPLRQEVYVADKNGKVTRLTPQEGTNEATFSNGFRYFLNVYSNATQPPVTTLCDQSGKVTTTLLDNAGLKAQADQLCGTKEFFTFTTPEGTSLNGWMIKPRDFDPSKRYPVVMYQYSGPGSQEVKDSWGIGFYPGGFVESCWAQEGIIVACVDGRGTGGRGIAFEQCTYLILGQKEAADQAYAAQYLASLPYVDKSRMAIWGWSFGGFNTLMSMTQAPVFKCGVAVAAPSNWKYYDTIYTERYMQTPQRNAQGYGVNPITRAANLKGDLLLIHGTADDNVHARNFYEVSEALVQAGIPFRQQLYTNRNHSIYGGRTRHHLFHTITDYWREKLLSK